MRDIKMAWRQPVTLEWMEASQLPTTFQGAGLTLDGLGRMLYDLRWSNGNNIKIVSISAQTWSYNLHWHDTTHNTGDQEDQAYRLVSTIDLSEHCMQISNGSNYSCNEAMQCSATERRINVLLLLNQIGLGNDKRMTKELYDEEPIYAVLRISKRLENRIHKATTNTRLTTEDEIRICF